MKKSKKMLEIEKRYNMEYKDILEMLYITQRKSLPVIAKELGYDAGNLSRQLKKFNIQARDKKDAFKNWWETTDNKDTFINNSKNIGNTILQESRSRDNLRKVMQTSEYKRKISKTKIGNKNAMYKENLTEAHRVKTRGIFGYKKWSKTVRERDNYTCKICGKTKEDNIKMVAHHLESYDTCEDLRLDINNGITLCNSCHNKFHNKHKGKKTTRKQFEDFLKEIHSL